MGACSSTLLAGGELLSASLIRLLGNPFARKPLKPEHLRRRSLGHFERTPELNLVDAHLERAIRTRHLSWALANEAFADRLHAPEGAAWGAVTALSPIRLRAHHRRASAE
jgi:hypothetical protein